MSIKSLIKSLLSWVFNPISMIRIGHIGRGADIGKGLHLQSPKNIHIGNNVRIGRFGRLATFPVDGRYGQVSIEDNCYIGDFFSVLAGADIVLKKDTLIASHVAVVSENHGANPEIGVKYGKQPLSGKPTTIGKNCWIGEKVMIMPGVEIGDWCVIGAGSVVTKSIPAYSMAVGNPARVIKQYDFEKHEWIKK